MLLQLKAPVSAMHPQYGWQLKPLETWLALKCRLKRVDYNCFGGHYFNSNHAFSFEKTLSRKGVSFLLETKHSEFFLKFETKPRCEKFVA